MSTRNSLRLLVLCASTLLAAQAHSQAPAPAAPPAVPDAMPFDIPYGPAISLERAKQVGDAAAAEARKRNWKMSIAVVDIAGDLVYLQKLDNTAYSSSRIAEAKARSSAIFRRPTKAFFDAAESGHPYVMSLPGVVAADGGIPIIENGKVIGAIGASGGTGAQDAVVSKAGADTVK